jgi:hypothetical protein
LVWLSFRFVGRDRETGDDLPLSINMDQADHLHCSVQVPGDLNVTPESIFSAGWLECAVLKPVYH